MSLATGMERMIGKNTLRVLVIEDDYSTARILRMCLEASGFEVSVTSLGGEALRVLEQDPPQAVILDLGLPDGLGGSVLAWLRESQRHDTPTWMIVSALDREEASRRYGPIGGHFTPKPFNPWDLVGTLEQLLGARGWRPT